MRIEIRGTNIEVSDHERREGERRALFALGRFGPQIRNVSIVLTDINGPRGGLDTSCRVRVTGRTGWVLTASDVDRDLGSVLTAALGRVQRSVARLLDRQTTERRPAWSGGARGA